MPAGLIDGLESYFLRANFFSTFVRTLPNLRADVSDPLDGFLHGRRGARGLFGLVAHFVFPAAGDLSLSCARPRAVFAVFFASATVVSSCEMDRDEATQRGFTGSRNESGRVDFIGGRVA
jgi:hypothetical protein